MFEFELENWTIESMTGYKPITAYYLDFSIADKKGIKDIKERADHIFELCKNNYKEFTEFVMVLNWKAWRWNEVNVDYCEVYTRLYEKMHNYALKHLKGEELTYYIRTTD